MSNEYKDWLYDKVVETLFDANVIDRVNQIQPHWKNHSYVVAGNKNQKLVKYEVWFSDWEGKWKFEPIKNEDC